MKSGGIVLPGWGTIGRAPAGRPTDDRVAGRCRTGCVLASAASLSSMPS